MDRQSLSKHVSSALESNSTSIASEFSESGRIRHFVVDNLLPQDLAKEIHAAFPKAERLYKRRSLRELKFVTSQMNRYNRLVEDAVFAFQSPEVVKTVEKIVGLKELEPDPELYAGGISMMGPGCFLNPHLDNSHDRKRTRYRVLNLLYYVTPDWDLASGGNLELWPEGPSAQPQAIESKFNRLVIMETGQHSWHSVNKVVGSGIRCCVSNYFFSKYPVGEQEYFHVTSFRGRPEEPIKDRVLQLDAGARKLVRKMLPLGIDRDKHRYIQE